MKTPDEIKKGLECCTNHKNVCVECPYCNGMVGCKQLDKDALAYIRQLEKRLANVSDSPFVGSMSQAEYFGHQPKTTRHEKATPPIGSNTPDA